ncbi:MAG: ketopantoate reductase family protein [Gaiellaceae bacterium]
MTPNRTVAVLGPGAVGGSIAVRLTLAGVHVVCVARPDTVGIIALSGLVLETRDGPMTARPEVAERLERPVGLLLVTVKAPMLEEALERVDPDSVAEGVVLPLLNGLEHMEILRERFPGRVAAGTISHFQAYRAGRVQIIEATPSPIITMASEELPRGELDRIADILRLGRMEVRVAESERRVLWHKAARISALAAATAATGRSIGELRSDGEWRERIRHAIAEACAVAEADGVPLRVTAQWDIIDQMADETTTSAARDVAAGRRSELDAILGSVLRVAQRHEVPTPTLTALAASAGLS